MARTPEHWDVEDEVFWDKTGKSIANRNLWISIPNLLCGFSVWLYWGMVIKVIRRIHSGNPELFNFTFGNDGQAYGVTEYAALLLTLPAVAGLVGATLRIPNSFMIAICGGRNVKFMTTLLLILPAIGAGIALQNPNTPFTTLIVLAAMSGVGGGAFASSMSNISFFFPKRMQGLALGLNAGLGNAGVSVMQFLIPWVITFGMFGGLGGDPQQFTPKVEIKDKTVNNGQTNLPFAFALDISKLESLKIESDVAMTVQTNSVSTPDDTFTLVAKTPISWSVNDGSANPFTSGADVKTLFVTNSSGANGILNVRAETAMQQLWIQNAALVWVPIMTVLAVLAWLLMNNLPQHKCGSAPVAIGKYLWLQTIGFLGAGVGVVLLIFAKMPIPELVRIFLVLIAAVIVTLLGMRFMTPKTIQEPLNNQFAIFRNKHNWVMTWLYVMTFGSFIGYAAAFPVLMDVVFGQIAVGSDGAKLAVPITNPNAPVTAYFIWIGAGVGALIRPVGGWLSDKLGGARVTQWDTWLMVAATVLAGYFVYQARHSPTPETFFFPFLITFVVLFATTGIGNGSTFRMIPIIFSKEQAGPVLGWTSAIAAYGAYLIPKIFATQIKKGTPEYALYGFAVYYASCLAVNWWFYARKNAEIKC